MSNTFDFSHLKVMVVDDSQAIRTLLKTTLNGLGIRNVELVPGGADCLKELKIHKDVDVIMMDIQMPILDGIETVKLIRTAKDSPNPFVPVIMISGHGTPDKITASQAAGAHDFLGKPFSAKQILTKIHRIVTNPPPFKREAGYFGPDHDHWRKSKSA